eukprot:scaffold18.g2001.t1
MKNSNGYTGVELLAHLAQPKCPFVLQLFHEVAAAIMGGGGRISGNRLILDAATTRWLVGAMAAHSVVRRQCAQALLQLMALAPPGRATVPRPPGVQGLPTWMVDEMIAEYSPAIQSVPQPIDCGPVQIDY